jgi:hypothetical protein
MAQEEISPEFFTRVTGFPYLYHDVVARLIPGGALLVGSIVVFLSLPTFTLDWLVPHSIRQDHPLLIGHYRNASTCRCQLRDRSAV